MKASAFVVGPKDGPSALLMDLAHAIGFESVQRYAGMSRAERQCAKTPLVFFLCSPVRDVRAFRPVVEAVRFSPSLRLRFLPLIHFTLEPSLETVKQCIEMGFDDVIALPIGGDDAGERISRQIGRIQTYYETGTYFGPDRRNRDGRNTRTTGSDHGGGSFRKIEILRSAETGVDVISDNLLHTTETISI